DCASVLSWGDCARRDTEPALSMTRSGWSTPPLSPLFGATGWTSTGFTTGVSQASAKTPETIEITVAILRMVTFLFAGCGGTRRRGYSRVPSALTTGARILTQWQDTHRAKSANGGADGTRTRNFRRDRPVL